MNNKILSIKRTSAIFLAIVLVAGTITLSIPSFMIGAAQAESDREQDYDDDEKSYIKYGDESSDEEKDNDEKSYGKDKDDESRDEVKDYDDNDDDKKSYEKDSYESQYPSYGKDNKYYNFKDSSSSSISIKKVKCNNINVNLNGIDVDIGAPNGNGPVNGAIAEAQAAEDEGASSYGSDETGYGSSGESSNNNNNFKFVCINNNNNTVVFVNETTPQQPEPEPLTCEECITNPLNQEELTRLIDTLFRSGNDVQGFCNYLSSLVTNDERLNLLNLLFELAQVPSDKSETISNCLEDLGIITLGDRPEH